MGESLITCRICRGEGGKKSIPLSGAGLAKHRGPGCNRFQKRLASAMRLSFLTTPREKLRVLLFTSDSTPTKRLPAPAFVCSLCRALSGEMKSDLNFSFVCLLPSVRIACAVFLLRIRSNIMAVVHSFKCKVVYCLISIREVVFEVCSGSTLLIINFELKP